MPLAHRSVRKSGGDSIEVAIQVSRRLKLIHESETATLMCNTCVKMRAKKRGSIEEESGIEYFGLAHGQPRPFFISRKSTAV